MNSQKVYHCGARCAILRKRESAIPIHLSMRRNRCGSHRHHNHAAHAPSESRRQRCADDATRLFHIALCVARALQLFFRRSRPINQPVETPRCWPSPQFWRRLHLPLVAIFVILLSCLCLCLTWCVCHEVARRERLIDTAAKTRRRQMSSMDELRRQTSVDRLSTLAENSVEGSNPGEVAVEVRGDSGGTLKVSSAI